MMLKIDPVKSALPLRRASLKFSILRLLDSLSTIMQEPVIVGREDNHIETEYLFHYTDSVACVNILNMGEIWATQLGQMNDTSEGRIVRSIAKNVLQELAEESDSNAEKNALYEISNLVGNAPFVQRCYIFSLSENGDSLSQWRAYTPKGGYSIGINRERLNAFCQNNNCKLEQCEYDEALQKEVIKMRILSVIQKQKYLPGAILENVAQCIYNKIGDLETYYKHQCFSDEREWRIVFTPSSQGASNYGDWKTRGVAIVGYQKVDISQAIKNKVGESPIVVRFSPGEYSTDRMHTIFWMLLHNGYAEPKIKKSNSPYMS